MKALDNNVAREESGGTRSGGETRRAPIFKPCRTVRIVIHLELLTASFGTNRPEDLPRLQRPQVLSTWPRRYTAEKGLSSQLVFSTPQSQSVLAVIGKLQGARGAAKILIAR